jgi:hypothetical protein
MRWRKRIGIGVAVLLALWFALLVVLDFAVADDQGRKTGDRVALSLRGKGTVESTDLSLVRGSITYGGLAVRRDDAVGRLALDVQQIRCDLPPLGWALVDSDCRELAVRGTRLDVSSAALFQLDNPKRRNVFADRVVIDDAEMTFAPSAVAPNLGKIAIAIDHAEAGPTEFRTPLSFLFALAELHARVDLPAGISVKLAYHDGMMAASGTLFGASPVEVPLEMPSPDTAHDPHEEMALLFAAGKQLATRLVEKRAEDWLNSKLR